MTAQDQRLLLAVRAKLERVVLQLREVKASDTNLQSWGKVLDARCEIATALGMLDSKLREPAGAG